MIIWGRRSRATLVATMLLTCAVCSNLAPQGLSRLRMWFTFYFIPMFPLDHGRYIMKCAACGNHQELSRASAEQFRMDAAQASGAERQNLGMQLGYGAGQAAVKDQLQQNARHQQAGAQPLPPVAPPAPPKW